jgi:hypothetical protein
MYYSIRQKREQRKINKKEKYFQSDLEILFLFIVKKKRLFSSTKNPVSYSLNLQD